VRGEGSYVWDDAGNRYLDCFGGVLTVSVGHANPKVVAAIVEQVKTLQHTSALYANKPQSDLAEKLYQITPGRLQNPFFHQQRHGSRRHCDHGRQDSHRPPRNRRLAPQLFWALRHCALRRRSLNMARTSCASRWHRSCTRALLLSLPLETFLPECGLACAEDIEDVIMTTTTGEIAAFMAETILGVGGFIVPPPGYFERAVEIARAHGGLFICDEVQTAWGEPAINGSASSTGTSNPTSSHPPKAWRTACPSA
jgi:4-aminobutyrate aminotransferase